MMVEEISKVAVEIAKKKGATILIDKSGPTLIGVSNFLYVDPAYDITEEVSKELGKDRPASATPAAGAAKADEAKSDTPMITVPGLAPKK
jgi:outer membrane protein